MWMSLQVMFNHYVGTVEMEANCMIDMINQQIIPAMKESGFGDLAAVGAAVTAVKAKLAAGQHFTPSGSKLKFIQTRLKKHVVVPTFPA